VLTYALPHLSAELAYPYLVFHLLLLIPTNMAINKSKHNNKKKEIKNESKNYT
jgi:fucose 4-O-acetylase-like acetyltransferase